MHTIFVGSTGTSRRAPARGTLSPVVRPPSQGAASSSAYESPSSSAYADAPPPSTRRTTWRTPGRVGYVGSGIIGTGAGRGGLKKEGGSPHQVVAPASWPPLRTARPLRKKVWRPTSEILRQGQATSLRFAQLL